MDISTAPYGKAFPLPGPGEYGREISRLQQQCKSQQDLSEALKDAGCMIPAVRHDAYMDLDPEQNV